jgi:threonine/homoserine/homoserine lactone efflux protein
MGSLMSTDKRTARRKGLTAAAVAGGAVLVAMSSPFLGVLGLVGAGYLTYDWFMFRAKRGMRF